MQEIVASVKRVTDIMGEITAASQEQTSGIEQVNQAITQMDQATQQNASLVEQAAAAAEALQDQAGNLAQIVSTFKLAGTPVAGTPVDGTQAVTEIPNALTRIATPDGKASQPRIARKTSARHPVPAKRIANVPEPVSEEWQQF
jgi:uncharacterized phage infection (PIP) family protein YhgE